MHLPLLRSLSVVAVAALALAGCTPAPSSDSAAPATSATTAVPSPSETPTPTPAPTPQRKELPRGGTELFPTYRLAGWCGYPGAPGQGRLGMGDVRQQAAAMQESVAVYAGDREVMPVMELIATTVHASPGADGTFRTRTDPAIIDEWLAVARENKALLLLNIQPGTADFLAEVKALEPYLVQPDVGVALDPEWAVQPGQVPGRVFGSTTGAKLDEVATYLAGLVDTHQLPEKVMLYHQLHLDIVKGEEELRPHPGVAVVKSIDGIGSPDDKVGTWSRIMATTPDWVHPGFKLFYEEDVQTSGVLMTPQQVMALTPAPDYVLYE